MVSFELSATLPRYIVELPTYKEPKLNSGEPKSYARFTSGINDWVTTPPNVPVGPVIPCEPVDPCNPVGPCSPCNPVGPVPT